MDNTEESNEIVPISQESTGLRERMWKKICNGTYAGPAGLAGAVAVILLISACEYFGISPGILQWFLGFLF